VRDLLAKYPTLTALNAAGRTRITRVIKAPSPRLAVKVVDTVMAAPDAQTITVPARETIGRVRAELAVELDRVFARRDTLATRDRASIPRAPPMAPHRELALPRAGRPAGRRAGFIAVRRAADAASRRVPPRVRTSNRTGALGRHPVHQWLLGTAEGTALLSHDNLMSYIMDTVDFVGPRWGRGHGVGSPAFQIAGVAAMLRSVHSAGRRLLPLGPVHLRGPPHWRWSGTERNPHPSSCRPGWPASSTALEARPQGRTHSRAAHSTPFPDVGSVNAHGLTQTSSNLAVLGPGTTSRPPVERRARGSAPPEVGGPPRIPENNPTTGALAPIHRVGFVIGVGRAGAVIYVTTVVIQPPSIRICRAKPKAPSNL
jgi:hypothetical protein